MGININPLVLSFPNFTLGQIIDPDQANQNNFDITNKVNEFIVDVENTNLAVIESIQDASLDVTTLATGIDDEVTTIEVAANMDEFPAAPGKALIIDGNDYEVFQYNGKDGNNFTGVTRGYLGPARAFSSGVTIKRFLTAAEMDADIDAIDAKADGAIVTADDADTKADSAIITANGADGKADSAIITADEAETKADEALGQDEVEPYTGALGAMKIATDVQDAWELKEPELDQAVIDVENAVESVEGKASEEWVNNQITDAKNELTNDIYRKDPVNTYDDLYTTYTEPEDGWIAMTLDSRNHYVYHAGEAEWKLKPTDINYADDDGTDGIITSTKFNKWNEHLLDVVKHGELIAFPGHYVVTEFDTPTAGDITETMYKSADDTVFLTKVTEFDTPTTEDITITIECVELGIHNKSVTEFDTPTAGDIKETVSEVV